MMLQWEKDGSMIYTMREKLDSTNAAEVKAELNEAIDSYTFVKLVIDMNNVKLITSIGLTVLLSIKKRMLKEGKNLYFRNIPPIILDIIDVTGFDVIFDINKLPTK